MFVQVRFPTSIVIISLLGGNHFWDKIKHNEQRNKHLKQEKTSVLSLLKIYFNAIEVNASLTTAIIVWVINKNKEKKTISKILITALKFNFSSKVI